MAIVKYTDGSRRIIPEEKGVAAWRLLRQGKSVQYGNRTIAEVYLDIYKAPDEYVEDHFDRVVQLHFGDWMRNEFGGLSSPDPARPNAVAFADRWGLTYGGVRTQLALKYLTVYHAR